MTQTDEAMPEVIWAWVGTEGHISLNMWDKRDCRDTMTSRGDLKITGPSRYIRADKLTPPSGLREAVETMKTIEDADDLEAISNDVLDALGPLLKAAEMVLGLGEK